MDLYAICWQELSEPWGWEPLADLHEYAWGDGLLPNGPFFWDEGEAEAALASIRAAALEYEIGILRDRDRERLAREQAAYEQDVARGHPLPGVTVSVAGKPAPPFAPEPPRPLSTDLRLRQEAERYAGNQFSIQTYEVPAP